MTTAVGDPLPSGRRPKTRTKAIGPPIGPDARKNEKAAEAWLQGLLDARADAERTADEPAVFELADAFLVWCAGPGELAPKTVAEYRLRLRKFLRAPGPDGTPLGRRLARDLRPGDLSRLLAGMKKEGYAPGYVASLSLTIHACLNWAARPIHAPDERRLIPANPFAGVARPKVPAPPKRYCGPEARAAFLAYAERRAGADRFDRLAVAMFRFIEATGCRPDEACRLEWAHVDWEGGRAVLRGKSTAKTGRPRVLPLTAETLGLLGAIRDDPAAHPRFVFVHASRRPKKTPGRAPDPAGSPWTANALAHLVRRWRDEAIAEGAPIKAAGPEALTLYALRRDLGADLLRDGASYADVAEVLGNSAAVSERHYASFGSEHAVNLAERVAERRRGKVPE